MTNMISELKEVDKLMIDAQQIQVVIHSLPNTWEQMKIKTNHSEGLNTFEHVRRNIDFEEDFLKVVEPKAEAHMT